MYWIIGSACAIGLAAIWYLRSRDGKWHRYDGKMRRFHNGTFKYRDLTESEIDDWHKEQW